MKTMLQQEQEQEGIIGWCSFLIRHTLPLVETPAAAGGGRDDEVLLLCAAALLLLQEGLLLKKE